MWIGIAAIFVLGVFILRAGLKGRRVGDHSYCAACGYDLHGKPVESKICPECGTDSQHPVIGERHRRKRAIAVGLLLLLIAASVSTLALSGLLDTIDWIRYKPGIWLAWNLKDRDPAIRLATCGELKRRIQNKELTADTMNRAAVNVLRWQLDTQSPWQPEMGDLLESGRESGLLADDHWKAYVRNLLPTQVELSSQGTLAYPPKLTVGQDYLKRAGNNSDFMTRSSLKMKVDGFEINPYAGTGYSTIYWMERCSPFGAGSMIEGLKIDQLPADKLRSGRHILDLVVIVDVLNPKSRMDMPVSEHVVITTREFSFSLPFELYDKDDDRPGPKLVPSLLTPQQVAGYFRDPYIIRDKNNLARFQVMLKAEEPAMALGFDAYLEANGQSWFLGRVAYRENKLKWRTPDVDIPELKNLLTKCMDVKLAPSSDAVRKLRDSDTDAAFITEIYDQEVVLKNVRVTEQILEPRQTQH